LVRLRVPGAHNASNAMAALAVAEMADFAQAFGAADHVIVLPIYAARETDTLGVSSAGVVAAMQHPDARCARSLDEAVVWRCARSLDEAVVWLGTEVRPGDVVLTLGAGDGDRVGEWLLGILGNEAMNNETMNNEQWTARGGRREAER